MGFRRVGVYERVGFKPGAWRDVGWWQLHLRAHDRSPDEPLDLESVRRRSDWETLLTSGQPLIRARVPEVG